MDISLPSENWLQPSPAMLSTLISMLLDSTHTARKFWLMIRSVSDGPRRSAFVQCRSIRSDPHRPRLGCVAVVMYDRTGYACPVFRTTYVGPKDLLENNGYQRPGISALLPASLRSVTPHAGEEGSVRCLSLLLKPSTSTRGFQTTSFGGRGRGVDTPARRCDTMMGQRPS